MKKIFSNQVRFILISSVSLLLAIFLFGQHAKASDLEFSNFNASPKIANGGTDIEISFQVSELPLSDVILEVGGNKAVLDEFDPITLTYDFTYTVKKSDPTGEAKITLSLSDLSESFTSDGSEEGLFAIDNTAPAAPTITSPKYVNFLNQSAYQLTGIAEPNAQINGLVSDGINPPIDLSATALDDGAFTFKGIDLATLADGPLALSLTQTDLAGNSSLPGAWPIQKDTVRPIASIISEVQSPTDSPSSIVSVEYGLSYFVKNGSETIFSGIGTGLSQTIFFNNLPSGKYNLNLNVSDLAQNETVLSFTEFTVVKSTPVVLSQSNVAIGEAEKVVEEPKQVVLAYKKVAKTQNIIQSDVSPKVVETNPEKENQDVAKVGQISSGEETTSTAINWSIWIIFLIVVVLVSLLAAAGYYGYEWIVISGQNKRLSKDTPLKTETTEDKIEKIVAKGSEAETKPDDHIKTRW